LINCRDNFLHQFSHPEKKKKTMRKIGEYKNNQNCLYIIFLCGKIDIFIRTRKIITNSPSITSLLKHDMIK